MKNFKNKPVIFRTMKDWQRVEAVLFGSGKYLTEEQISQLAGVPKKNLKKVLNDLRKRYEQSDTSLAIFNENESWKLNVKEEFSSIVKNVISEAEMARPVMETLAIIAYKSPVMQAEVIDMRGSGAYEHIALLEDKEFITKEKFGRTFKLKITPKFYDYFDIEGDSKLRKMFKDVKKPETLGTLEVYTEPITQDKEQEFSDKLLERMKKVEETPHDFEAKRIFLDDFDKKFEKTKSNIDETDKEMGEFRKMPEEDPSVAAVGVAPNAENSDNIAAQLDKQIDELSSITKSVEEAEETSGEDSADEQNEKPAEEPEEPEDKAEPENEKQEEEVKPKKSQSKKSLLKKKF
jgi:segregation and condensation protein B